MHGFESLSLRQKNGPAWAYFFGGSKDIGLTIDELLHRLRGSRLASEQALRLSLHQDGLTMHPNPLAPQRVPATMLGRLMNGLSVFTLVMTFPQVLSVWSGPQAGGVSLWSWSAYLLAAVVWLVYGVRQHDKHIYLPCIGWILLDGAIVIGLIVQT